MQNEFTLAITGDSIINRRVSVCTDEAFLSLVRTVRDADVGFTHLETLIHDYEGPEIYPAAEAGWTWMRSPRYIVDELKWTGFDIVSHASNHSLDYSYGGLYSTWKALDDGGLPYCGTGRNLAEAREPAYLDTPKGRVALISMCSSFVGWAKAGEARPDMKGRPGLNPLRFYGVVDRPTLEMIKLVATKIGWVIENIGKTWLFNAPGIHMATYRFAEGDQSGVTTVVDEDDAEGNLRSIRDARHQADWVLVTLHNHEWDTEKNLSMPPKFVTGFARACIDAGADAFIGQGSHSMMRGMETYKDKPIFYDPGDFFMMSNTVTKLPSDFYLRPGYSPDIRNLKAMPSEGFDARIALPKPLNPVLGGGQRLLTGGPQTGPGCVVAICNFSTDRKLTGIKLYPFTHVKEPRGQSGVPMLAEGSTAKKIIEYMASVSTPFGTNIEFKDGIGLLKR